MTTTAIPGRTPLADRPPAARISGAAALSAIAVGAACVLALWWNDTASVTGLGGWVTGAGRITGLLAGYAVVVLLALMARVPALERGVGSDRLARWHAMGGRYTVSLAVAHTLLIIWGYALTQRSGVVAETGTLLLSYPDVLMATVALGLLVMVGVVSARAARRRLGYETWHLLHLYTYLAIALAFSHQFATGADFVSNPAARIFWSAMYVCVAGLLLWYRLIAPVRLASRHRLRVLGVQRESHDVVSVYVGGRRLSELAVEPGQFFRWRFLTRGLWWAANPYSLSAPPRGDVLRITVKIVGAHSAGLLRLRPGTRVIAEGPSGGFTAGRRRRRKVLLIGGGVGITPLRALFETLPGRPGDLELIYRTATPADQVLRSELDGLAHGRGARVHYLVGPPRTGPRDHLSAAGLRRVVPDVVERDVFLCGPETMMAATVAALRELGVPKRHIHLESFTF
jgi:ferredoxin-NADP reductase/DMSO/TMAO reductase YedYZ heme-binding membrane subunit